MPTERQMMRMFPSTVKRKRTKLSSKEETLFQEWYADHAGRQGLNADPDDPRHQFDYRGWWSEMKDDPKALSESDHGPQEFKDPDHPTRWKGEFMELTGKDPDKLGLGSEEAAIAWLRRGREEDASAGP